MRILMHDGGDLSLASAVKRHVRFVYKQANQISGAQRNFLASHGATLSRHFAS